MTKINAFLPMRKGSQRIKEKNIKEFAGIAGGLTAIKISQLLKSKNVDNIIVSTDDEEVKKIASSFQSNKIVLDDRPAELASSRASTDDLIKYVSTLIDEGLILWTHVTSPFVNEKIYDDLIEKYFENLSKYDSAMTVNKIQTFLWNREGPINYDRSVEKWPRTQTLSPVYELNSGAFLASIDTYREHKDRIGKNPLFYELDNKESFDIDWPDDFEIAELIWSKNADI